MGATNHCDLDTFVWPSALAEPSGWRWRERERERERERDTFVLNIDEF